VDLVLGSLVYQLSGGISLAYNLRLGCTIAHWKGILEEIHFWGLMRSGSYRGALSPKNSFRPSKWPQKFRNRKTTKNSKLPEHCFELVGIGGLPLIYTWINPPSLGRNNIHCVELSGERGKCLLNLNLGEMLTFLHWRSCVA
jgi:hypothetical protein